VAGAGAAVIVNSFRPGIVRHGVEVDEHVEHGDHQDEGHQRRESRQVSGLEHFRAVHCEQRAGVGPAEGAMNCATTKMSTM
jgi:hypothetical protein